MIEASRDKQIPIGDVIIDGALLLEKSKLSGWYVVEVKSIVLVRSPFFQLGKNCDLTRTMDDFTYLSTF